MKRTIITCVACVVATLLCGFSPTDVSIEKRLLYDQHTLGDTFPDKDGTRGFQFDKIRDRLFMLDSIQQATAQWGILQNVKNFTTDEYHSIANRYGVEGTQSAPLYVVGEFGGQAPERYDRDGSHQSSLGLYLTGETYIVGNGYSLLLDGLEAGINDHARERAIVVHGAVYANPSVIASAGRLGRSWSCPALPPDVTKPIIDTIQ